MRASDVPLEIYAPPHYPNEGVSLKYEAVFVGTDRNGVTEHLAVDVATRFLVSEDSYSEVHWNNRASECGRSGE